MENWKVCLSRCTEDVSSLRMAVVSEMATISEARKSVCRHAWNRNKINQDDSNVGSLSKNYYWLQFGFSLIGSSSKVLLRWPHQSLVEQMSWIPFPPLIWFCICIYKEPLWISFERLGWQFLQQAIMVGSHGGLGRRGEIRRKVNTRRKPSCKSALSP